MDKPKTQKMTTDEDLLKSKIMIVDDQAANVLFLEKFLRQEGYTLIRSATDSRLALEIYLDFKPDIVLLDLNMPHMDGFEVMKQITEDEDGSYAPILVLTAQNDDQTCMRALKSGAMDFLSKPMNYIEMSTRIKNMLRVRLLYGQVRNQNEILDRKVKERTQELEKTRLEVIERLGRAAEYRDNETGFHVKRMSRYSFLLAQAYGLSDKECQLILVASPMHDVGKIGTPDHILLKEGPLTPEEWKIMKQHPSVGAHILSGSSSELMEMAATISLTHQERWDGSGYPKGLKGEEIPLVGRIIALADVFDALTTERPYKKAWSVEDAITEIEDKSDIHFDPKLVVLFKETLPEILKIKKEFNEVPSATDRA
jgi:putative two-component system response regulator